MAWNKAAALGIKAGNFTRSDLSAGGRSMRKTCLAMAALAGQAQAAAVNVSFSGPGVSGSLVLTYGAATDKNYPNALEVTGISGTFSDTNIGIVNASVGPLVPITRDTPESDNLLAPK